MNDKKKSPEKQSEKEQIKKTKKDKEREKRAKTLQLVNIITLMTIFAGITVFMTFGQRPNVSYTENRDLEKPPEFNWEDYWAGKVTDQFGKYYNDTVPMRSTWKLFISNFRAHLGIKYKDGVTIVGTPPTIETPSKPADTSRPANSVPDVVIPGGNTSNKVPDVVIPGQNTSEDDTSDRIPDVVIPGQNTSEDETSRDKNKVPDVVVPGVDYDVSE